MTNSSAMQELVVALNERDNFVICGHVSPDGDCIGSQIALAEGLRALGKTVTCLLATADAIDYSLAHLPGVEDMVVAKDYRGSFDTFISVDVPLAKRMGEEAAALHAQAAHTITIDHHPSPEPMSEVNYIDDASPACAMIIWELLAELGVSRTATMASATYVGLMTDTGRFQYQNTNADALRAAAEMVNAGADPADLATLMYQNRSPQSMALEERMLANHSVLEGGQFAYSFLTIQDFVDTGATRADAEPLIDVLRCMRGVRVACLLREQDNNIRGSLRAKDETDVSLIAQRLGGGGHKAAAGFTFEGSMEEAIGALKGELSKLAQAASRTSAS